VALTVTAKQRAVKSITKILKGKLDSTTAKMEKEASTYSSQ
jgi:hypothetical protein